MKTFHLVPVEYWEASDPNADYVPSYFNEEGFIHCTTGEHELAATGNKHYKDDQRPFNVLVIELDKVKSKVQYDAAGTTYPHIYGPLNRDAITHVLPALRLKSGQFLVPDIDGYAD